MRAYKCSIITAVNSVDLIEARPSQRARRHGGDHVASGLRVAVVGNARIRLENVQLWTQDFRLNYDLQNRVGGLDQVPYLKQRVDEISSLKIVFSVVVANLRKNGKSAF